MADNRFVLRYLIVACLCALGAACHHAQSTAADYEKRGDAYMADHKTAEAIIEYRNAVALNGQSGPLRQKLGAAYAQGGDYMRSFGQMVNAADLMKGNVDAQLRAGSALLLVGNYEDAAARADRVLKIDPNNIRAQILKGNALAGLKDLDGAIAQVENAIKTDPSQGISYGSLAMLQFAKGDTAKAEASFKQAVAADPRSVEARLALANLYWAANRRPEAEASLRAALTVAPNNILANRALAIFYMGSGRVAEAEAPLKTIAATMPGPEGRLTLADYYIAAKRFDEGKAILAKLAADPASGWQAKIRLASVDLTLGDLADAEKVVDQILARDPKSIEGLVAKAQLQILTGNAASLTTAHAAVAAGPDSPQAEYVLGEALEASLQTDAARTAYQDALRLNARFAPGNFALGRMALNEKRYADAVTFAEGALTSLPSYADALLLLAQAEIASGHAALAESAVKTLTSNYPTSAAVQAQIGQLQFAEGDMAGSRAAFERALTMDPGQIQALTSLTALDLRQQKGADARARLDRAIAKNPKNAALYVLVARTDKSLKDPAGSEKALKVAIAVDPNDLEAYDLLARLYVEQQRLVDATAEFQAVADRQPNAIGPRTAIAMLLELQNKWDDARVAYEKTLAIDPRAAVAANNLAQIYADRNGNLDVALQLAKTAKSILPKVPEVDDTIGWIYLKKKMAPMAVSSLQTCVAADPNNALYLYHLGLAYVADNKKDLARQSLEKALRGGSAFDGSDNARTVLKSLKG